MARLLGPDENSRLGYRLIGGRLNATVGLTATVYSDSAGTTLASIATYDGTTTPGAVISGSTLTVGTDSKLPRFWFPTDTDTLYVKIGSGEISPVYADTDFRLDELNSMAGRGYLGMSVDPPAAAAAGAIITAGVIHLAKVYVPAACTITNVVAHVTDAGATLTANQCLAGLYDSTGALLKKTGNMASTWNSTGAKVMPLSATQDLTRNSFVYAAFLGNGTTMPKFSVGSTTAAANMGLAAGATARFGTILTGQTDLPSSITVASIAISDVAWVVTLT